MATNKQIERIRKAVQDLREGYIEMEHGSETKVISVARAFQEGRRVTLVLGEPREFMGEPSAVFRDYEVKDVKRDDIWWVFEIKSPDGLPLSLTAIMKGFPEHDEARARFAAMPKSLALVELRISEKIASIDGAVEL